VRKVFIFGLGILFISIIGHFFTQIVYAEITIKQEPPDPLYYFDKQLKTITLTFSSDVPNEFRSDKDYSFFLWKEDQNTLKLNKARSDFSTKDPYKDRIQLIDDKTLEVNIPFQDVWKESGWWIYRLYLGAGRANIETDDLIHPGSYYINPCSNANNSGCPSLGLYQTTFQASQDVPVVIINIQPNYKYKVWFKGERDKTYEFKNSDITETATVSEQVFPAKTVKVIAPGKTSPNATLCLSEGDECDFSIPSIQISSKAVPLVTPTEQSLIISNDPGIPGSPPPPTIPTPVPPLPECAEWANLQGIPIPTPQLEYIDEHDIKAADLKCITVATAVGPISTDPFGFVKSVLSLLLSVSGGITVVFIIIAGYRLMTSQGNPEAVKAGQEQLTSAIVGLLFIIFSLVILQVVGVDILHIPGFEK